MNKKNIIYIIVTFLLTYIIANSLVSEQARSSDVVLSEFLRQVDAKNISSADIRDESITYKDKNGATFSVSTTPFYTPKIIDALYHSGSDIKIIRHESTGWSKFFGFLGFLLSWLPMILIGIIWFSMFKQMNGKNSQGSGPFSFGKSKAQAISPDNIRIRFNDVAGIDEAREELQEIVDFLKNREKYVSVGGKIPKGCLLVGQPGTGKTLLAKAIAGEAGVPFFFISGSDFVEMFVGVGASRVRDLFGKAKKSSPCIIFIDEIDAVGRHRGVGIGGGNDEREQTLNQMLVEMDGFEENSGVVVIAATNREDVLDPALLRPGRFDRRIHVPLPDVNGRTEILKVHTQNVSMLSNIDLSIIARGTPGFSGAELANLVNEAALLAAKRNKSVVTSKEMEDAKDKIMMGTERKSLKMSEAEKKLTAYHEGGHALVAVKSPASDPIHKATIIPRGGALGLVMRLPEADRLSLSREKMYADITVAMAGRAAEEIIFGHDKVTSGASSDIQQATKMARSMVTKWGLSDKVGTIYYATDDDRYVGGNRYNASDEIAKIIDDEVRNIVDQCHQKAKQILTDNIKSLHDIANALLEYETITGDEVKNIIEGITIRDKKNNILEEKTDKSPFDIFIGKE